MEGKGLYTSVHGDTYEGTWKDHKVIHPPTPLVFTFTYKFPSPSSVVSAMG